MAPRGAPAQSLVRPGRRRLASLVKRVAIIGRSTQGEALEATRTHAVGRRGIHGLGTHGFYVHARGGAIGLGAALRRGG